MSRKELLPSDVTALIDTREQTPLCLDPLKTESATMATADYTVKGLEHVIAVERKSLQDYIGCVGYGRERFEREMHRILAFPNRLMVIEGTLSQLQLRQYRGNIEPNAAIGSLLGWMARGIPILFAGSHEEAGRMVARFLFIAARRRWDEAQGLCSSLKIDSSTSSLSS